MRSAFAEARFDSGCIASPASLTIDSVRREPSETRRSNERAGDFALQGEEFRRRLGFSQRLDGFRSLLDAFTAASNDVLAEALGTGRGDTAGGDERFDIRLGDVGEFLGDFGRLADGFLAALTGVGQQALELVGTRQGVELGEVAEVGEPIVGVDGHEIIPFSLSRRRSSARGWWWSGRPWRGA